MRDAAACLSLANLCFLKAWAALLDPRQLYFRKLPPDYGALSALVLNVVVLGAVFWGCLQVGRRVKAGPAAAAARCGFCVLLLFPIRNIRLAVSSVSIPHTIGHTTMLAALGLAAIIVVLWNRRIATAAGVCLVVLAPLVPVNIVWAAAAIRSAHQRVLAGGPRTSTNGGPAARRVMVLVFDELDYRLAFGRRPHGLGLAELDRLRAESVFALNAYPAQHETLLSMPSIITGRPVSGASHLRGDDLELKSGGGSFRWSEAPNMFTEARALGFRTALVGWYHPYCRVLGKTLDDCYWEAAGAVQDRVEYARPMPSSAMMLLETRRQLAQIPFFHLYHNSEIGRPEHAREYLDIHERALRIAADASFGLVLLHYPIPHLPGIFSIEKRTLDPDHPHQYIENLPLVDAALGELRAAMERSGVWNSTDVILTSDHPLRFDVWPAEADIWGGTESPLVPLMIKLAGASEGLAYAPAVNNRVVHDLALALLEQRIATPRDAAAWLDVRSSAPRR